MSFGILVFLQEVHLDSADQLGELVLVLASDVSEGNNGGSLLVNDGTKSGLVLDDAVRHAHLSAESRDEDNQLDGVNIISNNDQRSLLGLDQRNDVVKTVFDVDGLLADGFALLGITLGNSFGLGTKTSLLFLTGFGAVLVHQAEELGGGVLVEVVAELSNRWWDLQTLVKDDLLTLKTDVFGPFDKSGQVTSRLNVLTDPEVLGATFKKRVLGALAVASRLGRRSGRGVLLDNFLDWLGYENGRTARKDERMNGVIERGRRTGLSKSVTINIALDQAV